MAIPKELATVLCAWTLFLCCAALDDCDWLGSGTTHNGHRSSASASPGVVVPVYLRAGCTSGRVTWLYPDGALRVVLKRPRKNLFGRIRQRENESSETFVDTRPDKSAEKYQNKYSGKEFRVCVLVHNMADESAPEGSPGEKDKKRNFPARLFLEGPRSLVSLYSAEDGGASAVRCFRSKNGIAAIFMEADSVVPPNGDLANWRPQAVMDYDIQPLETDNWDQCKPCTKAELMQAFCTSDTVIRGRVTGVQHVDTFDSARVTVKVTRHVRHHASPSATFGASRLQLHASKRCSFEQSFEELVFMARLRLTHLTLTCSTTLKQWAAILHEQRDSGEAPCILEA